MKRNLKPVPKIQAVGVSGSAAFLLIYAAQLVGIDLPEPVAGALIVVAAFFGGWLKKS